MKTIIELLGCKAAVGDVGIEIEAEGKNLVAVDNVAWRSEDDGSLRGVFPQTRCEYIFAKPQKIDKVEAVLGILERALADSKLEFSHRCSVHVHVNVQKMQYQQMLAYIYAYYLLEEPFFNYCGKKRKGNNFCLRLADAEGVLDTVGKMFEMGEEGIHYIQRDLARYAALNVEALQKYGSLEFRGMEGNLDVERITTWCKALVALREYSAKLDNPKAVYERFNELGAVDFMEEALGELADNFQYLRVVKDMDKSFSISLDLPFAYERFTKQPKVEEGEWYIGQIVNHAQAIAIIGKGGYLDYVDEDRYRVAELPKNKKAAKMPAYAFAQYQIEPLV